MWTVTEERSGEEAVDEIRDRGADPASDEREFVEGEGVDLAKSEWETPRSPTGETKDPTDDA